MDDRQVFLKYLYTPKPSLTAIRQWKESWINAENTVPVNSFIDVLPTIRKANINPLMYQYRMINGQLSLVFLEQSDLAKFRLIH